MAKNYWLLKTEPECWSWQDQKREHTTPWDGVKNHQAQKNIRAMQKGDEAFFYHTGKERSVVGAVTITSDPYPDPSAPNLFMVNVTTHREAKKPLPLSIIKQNPDLQHLALIKQGRLSVVPIDPQAWQIVWQASFF